MKLIDLYEKKEEPKGTYVGVRLTDESKEKVLKVIKEMDVPNPIGKKDMHLTLIYSRKYLPDFSPRGKLDKVIVAKPKELDIFPSKAEGKDVLVVKLTAPALVKRHKEIMKEHEATYDYAEYIPHLTLSYNCKEFDIKKFDISKLLDTLEIDEEYDEELDFDKYK
jgi:hypothetical protein